MAARGKLGPAGVGRVIWDCNGDILFMLSKYVGVCDSNEAEVIAILESLRCFTRYYQDILIAESNYYNAVAWVSN